jgi:hypothetical protein
MRQALNENPAVQMAVLGVIGVIFAVMIFTQILKKDDAAQSETPSSASAPAGSAAPETVGGTAAAPGEPGAVAPPASPAAGESTAAADGLLPTRGLPKDLLIAYAKDRTIALLVVDPKGTADKKVRSYTERLDARSGVEVFVVDVKDIADYSRVTSGVGVSRVPALVVIRPRRLTENVPTATVSYGFRGPQSVEQALDDSLYDGRSVGSYP